MKPTRRTAALTAILLTLAVSGCATRNATMTDAYDPLQPINRVIYRINDVGDRYLVRPVAVGYTRALPQPMRTGIGNFFSNLLYPVTIANDFLQGKFRQGSHDGARFLLNSTVGLAGLFDPATRVGLMEHDEDLDQTLAVWGIGEGPYLVVPLIGPRTLRHLFGTAADAPLTPYYGVLNDESNAGVGAWVLNQVDNRSRFLDTDRQVFEAYDPYIFVRDAYLQNRRYLALDGNVPEDDSYLDDPETYDQDTDNAAPDDDGQAAGGAAAPGGR